MNRRWPITTSWTLVAATGATVLADLFTGAFQSWVTVLAAGAAAAQLCVQRHGQHGLMAALMMASVLAAIFAPSGPWLSMWQTPCAVLALLVGSRAVARWLLRNRPPPVGDRLLWLSGAVFALTVLPLLWPAASLQWLALLRRIPISLVVVSLVSALAQFVATPWLVKTIPGAKAEERPAIGVWLLLLAWGAATRALQHGRPDS